MSRLPDTNGVNPEVVSRVANATWLIALLYAVGQWIIALRASIPVAWAFTGFLALSGAAAALFCLFQVQARRRRDVWMPATLGLILNAVAVAVCIGNIL